ncbi:PREDICTED: lysophosphatidylcholine acyltransferase 1-like, partial [Condylura cristata]|uniref:lysophosphatidylcholine acyltransferase 1-like n=1 Tax=Condylura cristata TaxID=143302 RepID=UPI000642EF93
LKPERLEGQLDQQSERARQRGPARLSLAEFAAQLDLPVSEALRDLFSLFDEHGDGRVDLREYVVALSVVCRPSRPLDTIRLAFKASRLHPASGPSSAPPSGGSGASLGAGLPEGPALG